VGARGKLWQWTEGGEIDAKEIGKVAEKAKNYRE
jgi:hypothetical protein